MKETQGIRSSHYSLVDGGGVVEINPYQVRYFESGPDGTTVIHFTEAHAIRVSVPFDHVSRDMNHVFGARVKVWGPDV